MTANKWYHFRMINTVMNYLLFWVGNNSVAEMFDIYVMGRDDVYFNESRPRNIASYPYKNRTIQIPPGMFVHII